MMRFEQALVQFRRRYFLEAIKLCGGNVCAAADVLGVHRNTIWREMTAAGIDAAGILKLCRIEKRVHRVLGRKPPLPERPEAIDRMFELQERIRRA